MHPPTYLILLAATVAASGFTVPAGQPDGVYAVSYDDNGTAIHTIIGEAVSQEELSQIITARDPEPELKSPSRILGKRQSDATYCGSSFQNLDHGDTDAAVEALKRQCNPGTVPGGLDFYSIAGSVVAYVCNHGSVNWVCTRNGLTNDFALITNTCGLYKAGWRVRWTQGNQGAQTGYEVSHAKFCGRGP